MFCNRIFKLPEWIIRKSFYLSVWFIEQFNDMKAYAGKLDTLKEMPEGTLGREIANCLESNKLQLVPGYESHDLKHSLLGFEMTPVDEIRMQAFMIGNGNISIPSIVIFLYGLLLLPHKLFVFIEDFSRGLNAKSIVDWSIEDYAHRNLNALRAEVFSAKAKNQRLDLMFKYGANYSAVFAMIIGAFGMMYCLPHLFSPLLEDLIGAGFPFVGGAILFSSGVIGLSIQNRKPIL